MSNRNKLLILLFLLVIIVMLRGTMAVFTSKDIVVNEFDTGSINIEIDEGSFENIFDWKGNLTTKSVSIKNNGKSDCLVRVAVIPRWSNMDGSNFIGDTSMIQLNFSNYLVSTLVESKGLDNYWIYGDDGYFYYMNKLSSGESTSELLSSVKIKDGFKLPDEYKDKILIVDIKTEAVQATCYDADRDGILEYQFKSSWINLSEKIYEILKGIVDNKKLKR
ncbi:BsaA family SipW-dependent biofilm matrix protein [Clostridium sp. K04]|uniref:BsaA family SipW-dependent biofilm matrix protein n=1 Tax=Clostridium sp. K04 TaxID=2718929 RepID=UPI001C8CB328|nr:BsaA family SipW-dependent biofilm matrix protein [Clostridium sp. K04]MBX9186021.1 hypothetical protein [Clostridium sp. K04]